VQSTSLTRCFEQKGVDDSKTLLYVQIAGER
jgi:hypothetical protein